MPLCCADLPPAADVLEQQRAGLHEPLVDSEGFPRGDIDVHNVLIMRSRVNRLQNDHKAIMKEIEAALVAVHAQARQQREQQQQQQQQQAEVTIEAKTEDLSLKTVVPAPRAFLRVEDVAAESPSARAGLVDGDVIAAFGTITADNFPGMPAVAQLVGLSLDVWC